jgi:hypothetical protein
MPFEIATLGAAELAQSPGRGLARLREGAAALHVPGYWSAERAQVAAQAVLAHRELWIPDFGGLQYCLGRAWYTHLETDRSSEYFARAPEADALVERALPGLQRELREAIGAVVGGPVRARRGWCGAGVHVFPAGQACARQGGEVHFDDEGLSRAQLRQRAPSVSLVLMLQPAEQGGALRLWDTRYEGEAHPTPAQCAAPTVELVSGPGDLVVFDSLRLHQIQPFQGPLDRISATLHGAEAGAGWESWF